MSVTLQVNQSVSVTTNIRDAYGAATTALTINYVSSNPTIVGLANNGVFISGTTPQNSISTNTIIGIANGTSTITVTINGGLVVDTIDVIVNSPPPAEISFVFGTPIP